MSDITAFGVSGWSWLNPPAEWSTVDGLTVTSKDDSDFWRTTHYDFVRDTGHALLRPVRGDFVLRLSFTGSYTEQYDQAGALLRIDERNWIKTGIEFVDGEHFLSAVVTRDFSDWSVVALPELTGPVSLVVDRTGDAVTVRYGIGGDEPGTLLRLAYFPPGGEVLVGPMCASPQGKGFPTRFHDFEVRT
ncbi:DUF1349 domain-containing protein [Allokutzneria albata]|uniref:Regulation of enolase protein 1, concanavalin A-like superfamily n=1 Tax=Allokutzneria albata TaxID=211114 RepID=A0A1G9VZ23_ALLAB|nr:DUF1349 domain-containing protein [Allokutzneria albata]SDM77539.1 hypothetical protein SAMN04489726_3314 [Allokutzneria albata]